jgi:Prealbumin-like fold domain
VKITSKMKKRTWGVLIAAAALTMGMIIPAGVSLADQPGGCDFASTGTTPDCQGPLAGSTFAGGDGNLLTSPITFGTTDWQNVAGRATGIDLPSGGSDNSFGQGTKEDDPNVTVVTGSIPPSKSDLTRFYEASEFANNKNFLYLAWERTNNLGSANMDFEINQKTQPDLTTTGPKTLIRTAGDVLITFDFTNGGGKPTLGLLRWLTSATTPVVPGFPTNVCFSSNSFPCWGDQKVLNSSNSIGAVNNLGAVTDPFLPGTNNIGALRFGEAAINLTDAGVFPPGICEAFGSAFLKSRSSASFPAEVKDFVAPVPVNISNCGTVNIHKQDDAGAPLAGAVFTLFKDNAPLDGAPPHGAEDTATSLTCTTLATGDCQITNVPFGDYWAVETTGVPNHDLAPDQSFSLTSNTPNLTISLTFVDQRQPGAIKVTKLRKHAADGSGDHPQAGVSFTVNGVTKQTDANGVACFDGLAFGTYTVHETVPPGYHGENDKQVTVDNSATCSDATYVGETVTFHNTPLTNITVSVDSQIDGGTSSTITCGPASASTGPNGDGSLTRSDLEPGTYNCTIVIDP